MSTNKQNKGIVFELFTDTKVCKSNAPYQS